MLYLEIGDKELYIFQNGYQSSFKICCMWNLKTVETTPQFHCHFILFIQSQRGLHNHTPTINPIFMARVGGTLTGSCNLFLVYITTQKCDLGRFVVSGGRKRIYSIEWCRESCSIELLSIIVYDFVPTSWNYNINWLISNVVTEVVSITLVNLHLAYLHRIFECPWRHPSNQLHEMPLWGAELCQY